MDISNQNESPGASAGLIYCFGPFELSPATNSLTRGGEPIRTQYLPFQMLEFLLERAGQMVTKEELRERLWGGDTFVEVDQNLYVIVSKLRELLSDPARQPRFIQTVSGRGYRFIGPVTHRSAAPLPLEELPSPLDLETQASDTSHVSISSAAVDQGDAPPLPIPEQRLWRRPLAIAVSLAVVLVVGMASFIYRSRHQIRYIPHERILMGSFSGDSRRPELGQILPFAVQLHLQQSPSFDVLPTQALRQKLGEVNQASREEQLRACSALGGHLLLTGQFESAADGYHVSLAASECKSGRLIASETARADSDASLMSAVDSVTDQMRKHLGEPQSTLQRFNAPLTQATTGSLAALEAFIQGEDKLRLGDSMAGITDYKMAIDLDPQFALAYARLGTIYINAQEPELGSEYYEKAFQYRDRTTDRERLYIAVHYYTDVTGEYQRAIDTYKLWASLYPNDWGVPNNLANLYDMLGQPDQGLRYATQLDQLNPGSVIARATLAQAYLENGEYPSLSKMCDSPQMASAPLVNFHNMCFMGAFAQDNQPAMEKELAWARNNPQRSLVLDSAAQAALFRGRVRTSEALFAQARENAEASHQPELVSLIDNDEAIAEGAFGISGPGSAASIRAGRNAIHASQQTSAETLGDTALALAISGAAESSASQLLAKAVHDAPSNSIVNDLDAPTLQAIFDLQRNNPAAAIAILDRAIPMQYCASTRFAPAYYRGLAFMQAKQWKNAELQFQDILAHKAILPFSVYVALAQVQLARSLEMQGESHAALEHYVAASAMWKDADPTFTPKRHLPHSQGLQQSH